MTGHSSDPDAGDGGMAVIVAGVLAVALAAVAAFYIFNLSRLAVGDGRIVPPHVASDGASRAR